jgi:hypothetical protein
VTTMYSAHEQARARRQDMLDMAAEQRRRLRMRRLGRARRRVERAERQLVQGRYEASRLNAELEALDLAQRY